MSDNSHLVPPHSLAGYDMAVLEFLWKRVKEETLCCCVSRFYCTSSKTLDKCREGCCGKCAEVIIQEESSTSSESDPEIWESKSETTEKSSTDDSKVSSDDFSYLS